MAGSCTSMGAKPDFTGTGWPNPNTCIMKICVERRWRQPERGLIKKFRLLHGRHALGLLKPNSCRPCLQLSLRLGGAVPPMAQTVPDPFCHKTRWKTLNISPETCQSLWGFFLFHIHDPNGRIKNMCLIGKSLFFILVFVQLKNRHMPLFCTIQT